METISHNVSDLASSDRSAAERLVGHALNDGQRIVIQVAPREAMQPASGVESDTDQLPGWCNVYEGLSDEQIADLEQAISRRFGMTRQ